MRQISKIALAASAALAASLSAGAAGATLTERTYEQCLADGEAECRRLDLEQGPGGDKFFYSTCLAEFHANCRAQYGVP